MKLKLLASGLDFLKAGIIYYRKFLSLHNVDELDLQDYIKLCVVSLHSSIELLSKQLLTDINELLLYQDLSQPVLENLKRYLAKEKREFSVHYFLLLGEKRVSPIDYQGAICRLRELFDLHDAGFLVLEELDRTKNRVVYFGFNQVSDYYEVIVNINQVLTFMQSFFYPKFSGNEEIDWQIDQLTDALDSGKMAEEEIRGTFIGKKAKQLHRLLSHICLEINIEVEESRVKVDMEKAESFTDDSITLLVRQIDSGKVITRVQATHLPGINALIFAGDFANGPVYFIIDYSGGEESLFVYPTPLQFPNYQFIRTKYWEKDKNCLKLEYSFENLKRMLFSICQKAAQNNRKEEWWKN